MESVLSFGDFISDIELGELVWKIFCNSTAGSTKRTYSVGVSHFKNFMATCVGLPSLSFIPDQITLNGMVLSFYIAYLFRLSSINAASTIINYATHLRTSWARMGVLLTDFDSSVFCDMKKGVKRLLPKKPDSRPAFLLPHYHLPRIFLTPMKQSHILLKTAVIWGFLGMFRFATYQKLGVSNLVVVGRNGKEYRVQSGSFNELSFYFLQRGAIGFYFRFSDKYHPIAYAFFCRLDHLPECWSKLCPVRALLMIARSGYLKGKFFPPRVITARNLRDFMRFVGGMRRLGAAYQFTPHSLRIGGHTFFAIKNMDPDFLHFLGRRAVSRVCQLYYRANAYDNVVRLNMFFEKLSRRHVLMR